MKRLEILRLIISALVKPKLRIVIPPLPQGCILDIGAGGEGIIAQSAGSNVIAVDKYRSEIQEAWDKAPDAEWMVADGTKLPFKSESLDVATTFFSCMYMTDNVKKEVFSEVQRILKRGGEFLIWDVQMAAKNKVFAIRLAVDIEERTVKTIYGVKAKDQTADSLRHFLEQAGFETEVITDSKNWFFIKAVRV